MANVANCVIQNKNVLPPYTYSAINAMPVASFSPRSGWRWAASVEIPMKVTPRIPAIIARVLAAFRDDGLANDGTPLETASTPDKATAPDEKARSSIRKARALEPSASSCASAERSSSGIGGGPGTTLGRGRRRSG